MKKSIALTLATLASALTLAACTGPSSTPTQTGASPMPSMMPSGSGTMASTAPTTTPMPKASDAPAAQYTQIERLARPAINEGLILSDSLLNTWNSVPPTADTSAAAKPIADEATQVLKALGNTDAQVGKLFGALLPDVMRIDTSRPSGYAGTAANPLGNVEPTKGIPIGGRMIKDDVIDTTLFLIVPDATNNAVPGLRSDNVGYDKPDANGHVHKPVMADFPYLAAPN